MILHLFSQYAGLTVGLAVVFLGLVRLRNSAARNLALGLPLFLGFGHFTLVLGWTYGSKFVFLLMPLALFLLSFGPMLLAFQRSLVQSATPIPFPLKWHLTLPGLALLVILLALGQYGTVALGLLPANSTNWVQGWLFGLISLGLISVLVYLVLTFANIGLHKANYKRYYTELERYNEQLLRKLLFNSALVWLILALISLRVVHLVYTLFPYPGNIYWLQTVNLLIAAGLILMARAIWRILEILPSRIRKIEYHQQEPETLLDTP